MAAGWTRERELVFGPRRTRFPELGINGPISWSWLRCLAQLPNPPWRTALLLHLLKGLQASQKVRIEYGRAKELGLSRFVVYRELGGAGSSGVG